jgi:RHH-type transcriptional regulator, rel operon repressor / antitoxin RelB
MRGVIAMLALRLPDDIESRLAALARKTGRTKSYYAREAILAHLGYLEDAYVAKGRLSRYRIGDFRLIAAIEDGRFTVLVLRVGHRREIYR